MRLFPIAIAILATSTFTHAAETPVHAFQVWGMKSDTQKSSYDEKLGMYIGGSNGYFSGRGKRAFPLRSCTEENITYFQGLAMIDKSHDNHPEKWSGDLTDEIVQALTVADGPCSNESPK